MASDGRPIEFLVIFGATGDLAARMLLPESKRRKTVTVRDVEEYVASMRSADKSPSSVARSLSVLRGLHRFLLD